MGAHGVTQQDAFLRRKLGVGRPGRDAGLVRDGRTLGHRRGQDPAQGEAGQDGRGQQVPHPCHHHGCHHHGILPCMHTSERARAEILTVAACNHPRPGSRLSA